MPRQLKNLDAGCSPAVFTLMTASQSNAAPAEASEAESEGIEYFEGDGFETEEDVDIPSKAVELDGSA